MASVWVSWMKNRDGSIDIRATVRDDDAPPPEGVIVDSIPKKLERGRRYVHLLGHSSFPRHFAERVALGYTKITQAKIEKWPIPSFNAESAKEFLSILATHGDEAAAHYLVENLGIECDLNLAVGAAFSVSGHELFL